MVFFLTVANAMGMGGIQARMEFNLCLQTLVRHDSAEMVCISDLFVWTVRNVTTAVLIGLGCFSDKDKTNTMGQQEWSGVLRHKNPLDCAIGSIALFFFYRWQVQGIAAPDFSSRRAWYFDMLSPGKSATSDNKTSKTTFTSCMKAGLAFLGVAATHFMHFMRVFGVYLAGEFHVHRDSTLLMGRWQRDKLAFHYQKCLKPADGLVGMAGFEAGTPALCAAYRVPRSEVLPPQVLLDLVFPWRQAALDAVTLRNETARAALRANSKDTAAADAIDMQAQAFLSEVLPFLSAVLLQDLALLQDVVRAASASAGSRPPVTRAPYPQVAECPVFAHVLFSHPEWAPFKQRVLDHVAEQSNALTQSAIVARADTEAISAIGSCMTAMCGQLAALTTQVDSLKRSADDMNTAVGESVREAIRAALLGAASAVGGGGGAPSSTLQLLSAPPQRAPPPPRLPAPLALPAPPVVKAYIDMGKIATVQRLYDEWHTGDIQTSGKALKDIKARCLRGVHAREPH